MRNLKAKNNQSIERNRKDFGYNNILETYRQHIFMAIGMIIFTSIITVFVVSENMKTYKNSCQSTFIYYKNGSSVLVSNIENSTKK